MEANLCRFVIVCLYMYCCWRFSYQEGRVDHEIMRFSYQEGRVDHEIPLTGLIPPHFCAWNWISNILWLCHGLFCVKWAKVSGDCLVCWYWWNCWSSLILFKLSYHSASQSNLACNSYTVHNSNYLIITLCFMIIC